MTTQVYSKRPFLDDFIINLEINDFVSLEIAAPLSNETNEINQIDKNHQCQRLYMNNEINVTQIHNATSLLMVMEHTPSLRTRRFKNNSCLNHFNPNRN